MKSLVQVTLSICLFLPFLAFGQIIEKPNCFQCDGNQAKGYKSMASGLGNIVLGNYAAGLGQNNISNGIGSLAAGVQCEASGDYAQAFGNIVKATARSSFASGFFSEANGVFSVAMGYGAKTGSHSAIALGFNVEALAPASFVTGRYVKSTASNAITMGSGNESAEYLSNNLPGTLMVGFNSIYPTLFVSRAPGGGNKTGRIGIGNITAPLAKLHILGDSDASRPNNASLYIQSAGDYYSTLWLGDKSHYIKTKPNADLLFNAANENFIFENGDVGIGTNTPGQKLEVAGNILTTGNINASGDIDFGGNLLQNGVPFQATKWQENGANLYYDEGSVGIGTNTPPGLLSLYNVPGQHASASFQSGSSTRYWAGINAANNAFVLGGTGGTMPETGAINVLNGKVGIGILPTGNKALEVNGDINFTGQLYENGQLLDINIWEQNGNLIYYNAGKVGIGTDTPTASLHIKDTEDMEPTEQYRAHFRIESLNGLGGGSTEVGRWRESGPIILQKAGSASYTNGGGPRLLIQQKSNSNSIGLSISTYTTTQGNVDNADIVAESSELYVRAQEDLILRSRTGDLYLQTADGAKSVQINEFGQVGIGTTTHIDQSETKLTVAGRIHAKEVKVTANAGGADFVFDDDYNLPDIDEVDRFIKANKHLPAIPSAKEMINNGIDLGEMQIKLLQKIEELTLYVIELKKENEEMKGEIENLKKD